MPRSLRFEYPGAYYHVLARGNRREAIFGDDVDRRFFLDGLGEACAQTGWLVHAYVLMDNHYHLVLETPEANLVHGMQWLQNAYTRRFNTRHQVWGRLFGDRYKSVVVEGGGGEYYLSLMDYVHLNPVRARMIAPKRRQRLLDYPWSSVSQSFAVPPSRRQPWLAGAAGLEAFGFADTTAGRRRLVERLDRRAREEEAERCGLPPLEAERDARQSHVRRGWYWGSQAFAEKLLHLADRAKVRGSNRNYRSVPVARRHSEQEAEALLCAGLKTHRLRPCALFTLRGNDPRKVALALEIRSATTVSNAWLAERLSMRSAANVSQIILRAKRSGGVVKI